MLEDLSVVLVSNRAPISFVRSKDGFDLKRGAGGLAGALDPVARRLGDHAVWIAAATSEIDRAALAEGAEASLAERLGYVVEFIDIEPDVYARYYDVVSNRMLWFANHCLWDELGIREFGELELRAWREAYEPVNERFARMVADTTDPSALVLFQDYHLATAPGHLRKLRPEQTIFHFTHSSFCGPDGLNRIPAPIPRRVIEGMLGCDLLGFHVAEWVKGFLECCERIGAEVDWEAGLVRHERRRTWVREYPIPIDARGLRKRAQRKKVRAWAQRFLDESPGLLLVRADRAEPSKNIIRGFRAFESLLERRKDLIGRVKFVSCLYPSRQSMPEYQRYTREIEETVAEINRRWPRSIDFFMKDDYDRTLGALEVYDALLVNSIMDGMNLVAKEGPALNERDGVLILSRGAGAFEELGEAAVQIDNPLSIDETSRAIEEALDMPSEDRAQRAAALQKRASATLPEHWINAQLEDLSEINQGREPSSPPCKF